MAFGVDDDQEEMMYLRRLENHDNGVGLLADEDLPESTEGKRSS